MNTLRIWLLCWCLAWGTQTYAGNSFLDKIEALKAEGKLPGLTRDGLYLPRALLLDELKKSVDSKKVEVKDLRLSDEKGTVVLAAHEPVDAEISIDFKFLEVDWPKRTIWLQYSETSRSASDTLLGRIFGTIAISVFEAASGSGHVESALATKPYFTLEKNRIGILLDRIPSLEGPLSARIGRFKLFDFIGIRRLATEKDRIRVALGPV